MDKFCKYCGTEHSVPAYPKRCKSCDQITWINPTPVAVLLQPVIEDERIGILIGERGINPGKGLYGLPGGFIDCDDVNATEAARREFVEEIGFAPPASELMSLFWSTSTREHLLIFTLCHAPIHISMLDDFKPNFECPAIRVAWEPETLSFQSHTDALERYFRRN